jgi:hypothetical protein
VRLRCAWRRWRLAFVVAVVAAFDESLAEVVDSPGYVPDVSPGYVPDDEPLPPPSHAHAAPAVDRARASAVVTATSGLVVLFSQDRDARSNCAEDRLGVRVRRVTRSADAQPRGP